ncbi:MAG: hypothetical protein QUS14_06530 [Pyrinomonadaceae bacterium]|nr:hypothetical protein [Pyrinomonadaceae bacterium]
MRSLFFLIALFGLTLSAATQTPVPAQVQSGEVSEIDGIPVLIKHLPEWEKANSQAVLAKDVQTLKAAIGDRAILASLDFSGGTEAVTAPYEAGRLLIVEYMTPQFATDADAKFSANLATDPGSPPIVYRRIGNYSVFVFDAPDQVAATALLEQVKYEKSVQWLGEDPFLLQKFERYFALTARDFAVATVVSILSGLGLAIAVGVVVGFLFFWYRERARAAQVAFSDAGGLTRLNLDGLSEPLQRD